MIRRLYDWTMGLAARKNALGVLAIVSFAESSVFPIPPDVLIIPMVLAKRARAWLIAGVCTISSVLGGIAGYAIGFYLFDTFGSAIVEFYGYGHAFETFRGWYGDWGLWIVFAAGITPLPYKVFTIASGVAALDPMIFILGSVASRGLRFYAVAGLLYWIGEPIRIFVERHLQWVAAAFVVILVGGFAVIRFAA